MRGSWSLTDEHRRVFSALALIGGEPDWSLAAAD